MIYRMIAIIFLACILLTARAKADTPTVAIQGAAINVAVAYWNDGPLPCDPTIGYAPISYVVGTTPVAAYTDVDSCYIQFDPSYIGSGGNYWGYCELMIHEIGHLYGMADVNSPNTDMEYFGPDWEPPLVAACSAPPFEAATIPPPNVQPQPEPYANPVTNRRLHYRPWTRIGTAILGRDRDGTSAWSESGRKHHTSHVAHQR